MRTIIFERKLPMLAHKKEKNVNTSKFVTSTYKYGVVYHLITNVVLQ